MKHPSRNNKQYCQMCLELSDTGVKLLDFYLCPYLPDWVSIDLQSKSRSTIRSAAYKAMGLTLPRMQKSTYKHKPSPLPEKTWPGPHTYTDWVDRKSRQVRSPGDH